MTETQLPIPRASARRSIAIATEGVSVHAVLRKAINTNVKVPSKNLTRLQTGINTDLRNHLDGNTQID